MHARQIVDGELRCAKINSFASLVALDDADFQAGLFAADGSAQDWTHRPAVEFYVETRKKKQPPRANVIFMKHGALVLDAKAKLALGSFLSKFGQLLELHLGGDTLWFYNVTNIIPCLDKEESEWEEGGMVIEEAFDESKVPKQAAVFKDPVMGFIRIYVNDAGRAEIERLASDAGLTGIECGSPSRSDPFMRLANLPWSSTSRTCADSVCTSGRTRVLAGSPGFQLG